ncbi:MAG: HAMP domain-containing histidine kinase [Myxococcaceae bacterium]|nr:HAMP domain-containing histidine kinase [Myxococcaceae bacterium]
MQTAVGAARHLVSQRLMDSLLHDVRNPLNALSINLDVLTEKVRRELGEIPASQEKNFKVMREQIFRVDAILKQFAEFLAARPDAPGVPADLSDLVRQVLVVLGHECRRQMIKVRQMVEPDLKVGAPASTLKFLVLQAIFRGVVRAGPEGELDVILQRDGARATLWVKDGAPEGVEPFENARAALTALSAEIGAELRIGGAEVQMVFPILLPQR